ncbi:MAG: DUF6503 family protein [Myxococcota bacterium]
MKPVVPIAVFLGFAASAASAHADKGKALIDEVLQTVGSYDDLKKKGDVEYTYVYESDDGKRRDVSVERYRFNGELSWAKYSERSYQLVPDLKGEVVQGWDGTSAWTTIDGKPVADEKMNGMSRFFRKTNFYWFAMMQKLGDPGLTYEYKGQKTVDGKAFELVKVGFESNVGDSSDTYLLYINPETKMIDQFLFTVTAFGMTDPLLMTVEYKDFDGVKLPVERKYTGSDWEGSVAEDAQWTYERMQNLKFGNGFETTAFKAPAAG